MGSSLYTSISNTVYTISFSHVDQQKQLCFVTLQSWWEKILHVFLEAMRPSEQRDLTSIQLQLSLGEFLSLVVEALRHKSYDIPSVESEAQGSELHEDNGTSQAHISASSSTSETKTCPTQYNQLLVSCQMNAIRCVPKLASLMQSCSSVYVFRRLLDILLKVTELPPLLFGVVMHVRPCLPDILQCRLLTEVLHSWMQLTGLKNVGVIAGRSRQNFSCIQGEFEATLINTAVRKLVLFVLKYAASVMEEQGKPFCG